MSEIKKNNADQFSRTLKIVNQLSHNADKIGAD